MQEPGTYHTYREEVPSSCRSGHSSLWEAEEGSHEDSQAEAQLHPQDSSHEIQREPEAAEHLSS